MLLQKVFQGLSAEMKAKAELRCLIPHMVERGGEIEEIVIEFLRECLPRGFSVGRGFIMSYDDQTSSQEDVVVYDEFDNPIMARFAHNHLFPIEGVYATIEVKSFLDKEELGRALNSIRSVKGMPIAEGYKSTLGPLVVGRSIPPIGAVFALKSTELQTLVGNLSEFHRNIEPSLWINLICVLDKGVVFYGDENRRLLRATPDRSVEPVALGSGANALGDFYILLQQYLDSASKKIVNMKPYYSGKLGSPIQDALDSLG